MTPTGWVARNLHPEEHSAARAPFWWCHSHWSARWPVGRMTFKLSFAQSARRQAKNSSRWTHIITPHPISKVRAIQNDGEHLPNQLIKPPKARCPFGYTFLSYSYSIRWLETRDLEMQPLDDHPHAASLNNPINRSAWSNHIDKSIPFFNFDMMVVTPKTPGPPRWKSGYVILAFEHLSQLIGMVRRCWNDWFAPIGIL